MQRTDGFEFKLGVDDGRILILQYFYAWIMIFMVVFLSATLNQTQLLVKKNRPEMTYK